MSWSFNITSKDRESLKQSIAKQEYCPHQLRELLAEQVDRQQNVGTDYAINVASTGHHDSNYCYGDFKVQLTRAV